MKSKHISLHWVVWCLIRFFKAQILICSCILIKHFQILSTHLRRCYFYIEFGTCGSFCGIGPSELKLLNKKSREKKIWQFYFLLDIQMFVTFVFKIFALFYTTRLPLLWNELVCEFPVSFRGKIFSVLLTETKASLTWFFELE